MVKIVLRAFLFVVIMSAAIQNADAQKNKQKGKQKAETQKYSTKSKKAIEAYEIGMNDFQYDRFQKAYLSFETASKIAPEFVEAFLGMSEVCRELNDYEGQIANIKKAVTLDSTCFVPAYYNAGVAMMSLGRMEEALEWLDLYKKFSAGKRNSRNTDELIKRAMVIRDLMSNPVPFEPRLVSENVATDYDQYWPSVSLDEEELVFTMLLPRDASAFARNKNLPRKYEYFHEDFYVTRKVDGEWSKPLAMAEVNTQNNEGAQALSPDGNFMFFTACGRDDSKGSCDIYFSRRTANGWSTPVNVGDNVNTPYWETQPCFSSDGRTLYFVSARPGGKGGMDIWKSQIVGWRSNGVPMFGSAVNLGDSINTRGDETSPFIHPDNKTLYFSSDMWPGLGGQDIFISRLNDDGKWTTPRNIGYPINTPLDNNGFIVNAQGTMAYFSSQRQQPDGRNKIDLLCFDLPQSLRPEPVGYIKGHVYDHKTMKPLGASIELVRLEDDQKMVSTSSDPVTGQFIVTLPAGYDYGLFADSRGYLYHSQNFSLPKSQIEQYHLNIEMAPIEVNQKIELRNIFFDTNSADLKPESEIELKRLAAIMKSNIAMRIEIGGHTDNEGKADYNQKLSERRAKTTADALVSLGIEASRITHKGYGQTQPVADNNSEEGRAKNRRIEVKITSLK